jgi:hypothetical protein
VTHFGEGSAFAIQNRLCYTERMRQRLCLFDFKRRGVILDVSSGWTGPMTVES